MELAIEPLSIVSVSIAKIKQSPALLLAFLPRSTIHSTIVVLHCTYSIAVILSPLSFVNISIFVSVLSIPMLFVFEPISLVPLTV